MTCDSAYWSQSYAWSRPNVVSVLIGYRFLQKFMFSFQTFIYSILNLTNDKKTHLSMYKFTLFYPWIFLIVAIKFTWQMKMNSISERMALVLRSLINNLFIMKSRDLSCDCLIGSTSRPYNKISIGLHFVYIYSSLFTIYGRSKMIIIIINNNNFVDTSWRITSSDPVMQYARFLWKYC